MAEQCQYVRYSDDVEVVTPDEEQVINGIIAAMEGEGRVTAERYRHAVRTSHAKSHGLLRLAAADARTAQLAGAKFARVLVGADPADFTLALTEQERLLGRAITDAGYGADQARLATRQFGRAAREEWQRMADASSGFLGLA